MRDLAFADVAGAVVTGWRLVDRTQLVLALKGEREEVRLRCRCDRCHWIVLERGADPPRLLATCHSCGTRVDLAFEAAGHAHS